MKTFDRAMYAMFLLVLLADVARAQGPAPDGLQASGELILRVASEGAGSGARVVRGAPVGQVQPVGVVRPAASVRGLGRELLTSCRAASGGGRRVASGPVRGLFDGASWMPVVADAGLPMVDVGEAFSTPLISDVPSPARVMLTGSPAP